MASYVAQFVEGDLTNPSSPTARSEFFNADNEIEAARTAHGMLLSENSSVSGVRVAEHESGRPVDLVKRDRF